MKTICVSQLEDGTFSVYEKAPEAAEPAAAVPGEIAPTEQAAPEGQAAASLDEALELVRQMLNQDARSPEQAMMDGYNKADGKKASRPTPQAVFGEGL